MCNFELILLATLIGIAIGTTCYIILLIIRKKIFEYNQIHKKHTIDIPSSNTATTENNVVKIVNTTPQFRNTNPVIKYKK